MYKRQAEALAALEAAGLRRQPRRVSGAQGPEIELDGRPVICLCSNNYLGLANHPEVVAAAHEGLNRYAAGTASVRFICGTFVCHRELEETLADFAGTQAALTYVSCWTANEALTMLALSPGPPPG